MSDGQATLTEATGDFYRLAERTHLAHVRYAASDEAGVIFTDPRDGRENFSTGQSGSDLDVGEECITSVSIRPFRPSTYGEPADRYVTRRSRSMRREVESSKWGDDSTYEQTQQSALSEVHDSLGAARAWCREHVPGYDEADRVDVIATRTDIAPADTEDSA